VTSPLDKLAGGCGGRVNRSDILTLPIGCAQASELADE